MQVSLTSSCVRRMRVSLLLHILYLSPSIKKYIKKHTRSPASQTVQLTLPPADCRWILCATAFTWPPLCSFALTSNNDVKPKLARLFFPQFMG